jgi:GTPase SAR1 family protein
MLTVPPSPVVTDIERPVPTFKIVVCGSRGAGKTCLCRRLIDGIYEEEPGPTPHAVVTNVYWQIHQTKDDVFIEVRTRV